MENQKTTPLRQGYAGPGADILAEERTLLAAERTFSAWLRTALSAMAGGLAIIRLIIFKTEFHQVIAHIAGILLIFWGCVLIVLASIDYKNMQNKLLLAKNYKSSQLGYFFTVLPLIVISVFVVWIIVL